MRRIEIDGSSGEGGGQILRSALSLALVTTTEVRLDRIRANRPNPGLRRQHLAAVAAAAAVGVARVEGASLGSRSLTFSPQRVRAGEHRIAVGSAGSATLVLQTILPALLAADGPSDVVVEGGTHNPLAPTFDFLDGVYLRTLRAMGARVEAAIERLGFAPAGGGRIRALVTPSRLRPIEILDRGALVRREARAVVARLPLSIAEREVAAACRSLDWRPDECRVTETADSDGPGNAVVLEAEFERVTEIAAAFGRRGVPAERVAAEAAAEMGRYLASGAPVGEHLADQLLVPLAIAGGGRFVTLSPTLHTRTNARVVERFLPVEIAIADAGPNGRSEIAVRARAGGDTRG